MNLFELFVKIGVDDQASGKLKDLGGKLGNGLKTAAKIGTAAVGAAAAGITALTTAAVKNYSEYEQLVGGVETLFSKSESAADSFADSIKNDAEAVKEFQRANNLAIDGILGPKTMAAIESKFGEMKNVSKEGAETVIKNAANAYKTAGLSANQYMETVTSFSASLIQSLGGDTEKAAKYADTAITDMSDNANKMGTDIEMIKTAYAGFAKQNYTMLDNLKLGYGGTKNEMERLLKDADALSDSFNLQKDSSGNLVYSYADVVDAIHLVQENMGIAGATALEAGTTIEGSVNSMKSAWANLVTGLADGNADIGQLVENLVTTIVGDGTESNLGVLGNVMPAVKQALNGALKLVQGLLPKIVQEIPSIINENLPILAEAAISIIQSLVDGISENQEMLMETAFETITYLAESFIAMLPQIVQLGLDLIVSLANGIAESLPELIPTIVDVVLQIVETLTNPDALSNLIDAAIAIIFALTDGIIASLPQLLEKVPEIVQNLVDAIIDNAPKLLESAYQLIVKLAEGIITNLPQILESGTEIVFSIIEGIAQTLGDLIVKGKEIVDSVKEGFDEKIEGAKTWGKDLISNFIGGLKEKWENLKKTVSDIAQSIKDRLGFSEPKLGPLSNFHTYAPDMMDLFAKGIRDNENVITDQIEKSFDFGERTMKFGAEYDDGFGITKSRGTAYGGTSIGNININIDGAKYSNERELAIAISEVMQELVDRKAAIYA